VCRSVWFGFVAGQARTGRTCKGHATTGRKGGGGEGKGLIGKGIKYFRRAGAKSGLSFALCRVASLVIDAGRHMGSFMGRIGHSVEQFHA